MKKETIEKYALYAKNFIFGVEDSLVSTVGLVSGVATTGASKSTIIVTGVILIFVEAFSMGIGSLLSEHAAEEYVKKRKRPFGLSKSAGFIMFVSYFLAALVPLSPYGIWEPAIAFWASIGFSLVALFFLGVISGKIFGIGKLRKGLEMFLIGGLAVLIGVAVGYLLQKFML